MLSKFGNCNICARRVNQNGENFCVLSKRVITDLIKNKCEWYLPIEKIRTCDICHRQYEEVYIDITDNNNIRFICPECTSLFNTCRMCARGTICAFHADQKTPDFIMRQVRQGNAIMQAQVRNPDKEAIYCTKCDCWNKEEKYCYKNDFGMCERYFE